MTWDRDEELELETLAQAEAIDRGDLAPPAASQYTPTPFATEAIQARVAQEYREQTEVDRRIEKAGLYRALRAQPLFAAGSASPDIIDEVTNEIRTFVLDRLETLVGLRQPVDAIASRPESQFSEEEVLALKLFASKLTGKPPALPAKIAPTVQPVPAMTLPTTIPVATGTGVAPRSSAPIPAASQPKPQARRQITGPSYKPMPNQSGIDAKIAQDAVTMSPNSNTPQGSFLSAAIQTAINTANKKES